MALGSHPKITIWKKYMLNTLIHYIKMAIVYAVY